MLKGVWADGLRDALLQLRHQRLLQLEGEGDTARIAYGDAFMGCHARAMGN